MNSFSLVIALAGHPLWRSENGLEVGGPSAFGYVILCIRINPGCLFVGWAHLKKSR